jgi:uncharacterized 2Fe-2S/4Fe-4S cluster protein (DUF4445 family)
VAGYVGADHVAMLLAAGLRGGPEPALALDIGTNTEICLFADGKMTSVSCASGPAFEGAHIKHGMRAATGAIERLDITDGTVAYRTVDGAPPVGLCGSGVLDAVAGLYSAGVIDIRGAMDCGHGRVRASNGQPEFVLIEAGEAGNQRPITVTQRDVREVLLAKGAIRAGIEVLLRARGVAAEEFERVVIAGAFGCYISVASAVTIGMLPDLPLATFEPVGNAAGAGARLAAVSESKWAEAQRMAAEIEYIELGTVPDFNRVMARASYLGGGPERR